MSRRRKTRQASIPSTESYIIVHVDDAEVADGVSKRDKRIYVTLNSLVFCINEARRRFGRIRELLIQYDAEQQDSARLAHGSCTISLDCQHRNEIVSTAWDSVDWLERARRMLAAVSGIRKRDQRYKSLMKALSPVATFRDMLQHYDRDVVPTLVDKTFPPMGSVIAVFSKGGRTYGRIIASTPARFAGDQTISIAGQTQFSPL